MSYEPRRHHTDHFARSRVDGHNAPNDTRIAAKAPLPVAVTQNHGLRRARLVIDNWLPAICEELCTLSSHVAVATQE
jgi:hypothetical protein